MEKTNVILCGYQWAGCKALDKLENMFDEIFVYTHESPHYIPDLRPFCEEKGIQYTTEIISLENLPFIPDLICSIYYRYIIDVDVISVTNGKIFNLHPSLLPKYRGCSSLTWAMINEETEVGYTYHYIDAGCDTGSLILQKAFNIEPWDTQYTLYQRAMELAMTDFENAVEYVLKGKPGTPQQGEPSYYSRGCPHDGIISDDWSQTKVKAFIKAMTNPPLPVATYQRKQIHDYNEYLEIQRGIR